MPAAGLKVGFHIPLERNDQRNIRAASVQQAAAQKGTQRNTRIDFAPMQVLLNRIGDFGLNLVCFCHIGGDRLHFSVGISLQIDQIVIRYVIRIQLFQYAFVDRRYRSLPRGIYREGFHRRHQLHIQKDAGSQNPEKKHQKFRDGRAIPFFLPAVRRVDGTIFMPALHHGSPLSCIRSIVLRFRKSLCILPHRRREESLFSHKVT